MGIGKWFKKKVNEPAQGSADELNRSTGSVQQKAG